MTREQKLALILGFALVLGVGVLISDHFSGARRERIAAAPTDIQSAAPHTGLLQADGTLPADDGVIAANLARDEAARVAAMTASDALAAPVTEPSTGRAAAGNAAARLNAEPVTIDMRGPDSPAQDSAIRTAAADPADAIDPALRPFVERIISDEPVAAVSTNGLTGHGPATSANPEGAGGAAGASGGEAAELTTLLAGGPTLEAAPATPRLREPGPGDRLHTVADRESLSKIAAKYYGTQSVWKQLADYNTGRVGADASVRTGQTLLIPPKAILTGRAEDAAIEAAPASETGSRRQSQAERAGGIAASPKPASKPNSPKSEDSGAATRSYTVQKGDNLRKIARRMLGSEGRYAEILSLNAAAIKDANNVPAGLVLKLPLK